MVQLMLTRADCIQFISSYLRSINITTFLGLKPCCLIQSTVASTFRLIDINATLQNDPVQIAQDAVNAYGLKDRTNIPAQNQGPTWPLSQYGPKKILQGGTDATE